MGCGVVREEGLIVPCFLVRAEWRVFYRKEDYMLSHDDAEIGSAASRKGTT